MKLREAQYAKTLYEVTKGKSQQEIDGAVSEFFKVLIKNGQLNLAKKIIDKFGQIWNKEEGIIDAEVISRNKLEDYQIREIESYLIRKYSAQKISINNKVDEKIKGGVIIRVEDEILDGSIANQLKMLKNNLSK